METARQQHRNASFRRALKKEREGLETALTDLRLIFSNCTICDTTTLRQPFGLKERATQWIAVG